MKTRIMYLIDVYRDPYAGTERQLYNLIEGLDRSRFEPAMTVFRRSAHIEQHGFPCPVEVLDITRLFSPDSVIRMMQFARRLKQQGYQLVHIFFNDASLIAPPILKLAGLKVVISRRDMGFWYTPARLAILRFNRLFIDHAVVNSNAVKQITRTLEWIPDDKIKVIYNGYASGTTADTPETSRLPFRNEQTRIIGIVANIRPVKRIDDLIRAFGLVRQHRQDVELVVVGSGDAGPLRQLAEQCNIDRHVHFLGARSDVMSLIRQFDVAVLCSDSEGLSNAIIEYIQAGVPVVCTDTGGNNELVLDGETGYLVPVGDSRLLAEKINRLLDHPEHAGAMARLASTRVAELCNLDTMLDQHAVLYKQLL